MDINIEMIPAYKIVYIRRTGPYGLNNVQTMEKLKSFARKQDLFNENTIILGIARDDPKLIEPKDCRYDTCLVIANEFKICNNYIQFGETIAGKYCVFKISHTVEAMQKAWMEIFSELLKRNYEFDSKRPIIERYAIKMINKHYCEICVPVL